MGGGIGWAGWRAYIIGSVSHLKELSDRESTCTIAATNGNYVNTGLLILFLHRQQESPTVMQCVRNKGFHFPTNAIKISRYQSLCKIFLKSRPFLKSREYTPLLGADNEPSNSVVVASPNPIRDKKQPSFLFNYRYLSLVHGRGAALASVGLGGLGLSNTLGQDLGVLVLYTIVLAVLSNRRLSAREFSGNVRPRP